METLKQWINNHSFHNADFLSGKIKAVVVNFHGLNSTCNLHYHYKERPDVPISINYAFYGYNESLDEILTEHSPIAQVENLPDIPYFVINICYEVITQQLSKEELQISFFYHETKRW